MHETDGDTHDDTHEPTMRLNAVVPIALAGASCRLNPSTPLLMRQDVNWLHTRLYDAMRTEDYQTAADMRDQIAELLGTSDADADWRRLGVPEWLADWLERLGYLAPTRIQQSALRSLGGGGESAAASSRPSTAAIVAPTGSGKTLSYLVPLLGTLFQELMADDIESFLENFLKGNTAKEQPVSARRLDPTDLRSNMMDGVPTPTMLVVVPTRELGVQVSLLAYRLLGGGKSNPVLQPFSNPLNHAPGNEANMFTYQGPRGVRVAGVWDEQTLYSVVYQNAFKGVHVIVGTPGHLGRISVSGQLKLKSLQAVVVDEGDACFEEPELHNLLRRIREANEGAGLPLPQLVLAGASLTRGNVDGSARGWPGEPQLITEMGTGAEAWAEEGAAGADPLWAPQRVPAGSSHSYYVVDEASESLSVLCRLIRRTFAVEDGAEDPPRAVVFLPSADLAIKAASRLQSALWSDISGDSSAGLWGLSVLIPGSTDEPDLKSGGGGVETLTMLESSLRVMEQFRSNQTSILVTTTDATRGLDFPAVTHVFNMGVVGSSADYVHRAGRVGRVGQLRRGDVISIVERSEVSQLLSLGSDLRFEPLEAELPEAASLSESMTKDEQVRALEDLFSLLDTAGGNDDGDVVAAD